MKERRESPSYYKYKEITLISLTTQFSITNKFPFRVSNELWWFAVRGKKIAYKRLKEKNVGPIKVRSKLSEQTKRRTTWWGIWRRFANKLWSWLLVFQHPMMLLSVARVVFFFWIPFFFLLRSCLFWFEFSFLSIFRSNSSRQSLQVTIVLAREFSFCSSCNQRWSHTGYLDERASPLY